MFGKSKASEEVNEIKYKLDHDDTPKSGRCGELDNSIRNKSEERYIDIVESIVNISKEQLERQGESKKELRTQFTKFFKIFISIQFACLMIIVFCKGVFESFSLSDAVIIALISSVFVETLGAIIIMINFSFDGKQETAIIKILNSVVTGFQKPE